MYTLFSIIICTVSSRIKDCANEGEATTAVALGEGEYEVAELSRRLMLEDALSVSADPLDSVDGTCGSKGK